ncbi:MAG: VCBS repeat-containing protein [Bacteroidetes bacterium]|nr:VCBS repeat-containing protein [Bacteroidota bacterium]
MCAFCCWAPAAFTQESDPDPDNLAIRRENNGYWILRNPASKKIVLKGRYIDIQELGDGRYLFKEDVTPAGKERWDYSYNDYGWSEEGDPIGPATDSTRWVEPQYTRYGVVLPGYKVQKTRYTYLAPGHDKDWIAGTGPYENIRYQVLDSKLKPRTTAPYTALALVSAGYAMRLDKKWGFLNTRCQQVTAPRYDAVADYFGTTSSGDSWNSSEDDWDWYSSDTEQAADIEEIPGSWSGVSLGENQQHLRVQVGKQHGLVDARTLTEVIAPLWKSLHVYYIGQIDQDGYDYDNGKRYLLGADTSGQFFVWPYPALDPPRRVSFSEIVAVKNGYPVVQMVHGGRMLVDENLEPLFARPVISINYLGTQDLFTVKVAVDSTGVWDARTRSWLIPPDWSSVTLYQLQDKHQQPWKAIHLMRFEEPSNVGIYHLEQARWVVKPGEFSSFPVRSYWGDYILIEDRKDHYGVANTSLEVVEPPRFSQVEIVDSVTLYVREKDQVGLLHLPSGKAQMHPAVTTRFPLKWRTPVGITTYRHTILARNGQVVLSTNGQLRNHGGLEDSLDVVSILDARTGKLLRHFSVPDSLDEYASAYNRDINGLAWVSDRLFLNCDNGFCYGMDTQGRLLWKRLLKQNLEGCPAVADLNGDGQPDVVTLLRNGQVYALNGHNGDSLWAYPRKLEDHYTSLASPAVCDLNQDGVADVIVPTGNYINDSDEYLGPALCALNGRTGDLLWQVRIPYGAQASPLVVIQGRDTTIWVAGTEGEVAGYSPQGMLRRSYVMGDGLYSSPVFNRTGSHLFIGRSSGYNAPAGGLFTGDIRTKPGQMSPLGVPGFDWPQAPACPGWRISATPVVADVLGRYQHQVLAPSEFGELFILDEQGTRLETLSLPAGTECTPTVKDIDGDGYLDILYAGLDGYLYCYGTRSAGHVLWGQFRGDDRNTGVLRLGW